MRKKNGERNYDLVARAIGRNLLAELLVPDELPKTPTLRCETQENIQERLEKELLSFFFVNALGSCRLVATEHSRAFWQFFSEKRLPDDCKIISGTAATEWKLETGERLIILKVLSQNVFPRKRK